MADPRLNVQITAETRALMDGLAASTAAVKNATSQIEGQFGKLGTVFENLKAPLMAVAGLLGGGKIFKDAVSGAVDFAKETGALSRALGTTAQESAVLSVAIGDIYGSTEEFLGGAGKLVKTLQSNEAALKNMGISTRDVNGNFRQLPDLLGDINQRLGEFEVGTNRDAAAASIFGKSWQSMLRYVQLTPEVMEEAKRKVDSLGLALGPDAQAKVKAYRAAMNDMEDTFKALQVRIGVEVMPALSELGQWFASVGPGLIGGLVSALRGLLELLKSKVVQVGLVVGALYLMRGALLSLIQPLVVFVQTMALQMSLGLASGVGGVKAFTGALGMAINPVALAVVAIGALAFGIERMVTAKARAREAFVAGLPAEVAALQNAEALAKRYASLAQTMEKTGTTEKEKSKTQKELREIQLQLVAMGPEYARVLGNEAKGYKEIQAAIEKVNEEKRKEIQVKRDSIAEDLRAAEAEQKRAGEAMSRPSFGAAVTGGILGTQGVQLQAGRMARANQQVLDLRQQLAKADLELGRLAKSVERTAGGDKFTGVDSETALAKLKNALAQARYEFEATAEKADQLVLWSKAQEVKWLEENIGKYALNAKERVEAEKMVFEARRDLLQQGHEATIESLKADQDAERNNGSARLALARKIAEQEIAVHGAASKEAAAARRELAKVEREVADQQLALLRQEEELRTEHQLRMLDMERDTVTRLRDSQAISAAEAISRMAEVEARKYEIQKSALDLRLSLAQTEAEQTRIRGEQQALEDQRTSTRLATLRQRMDLLKQEDAGGGWLAGINQYLEASKNAFQTWKETATSVIQGVESAFATGIQGILSGNMTLGQGLKAIWGGIVQTIIGALAKLAAQWIVAAIAQAIFGKAIAGTATMEAIALESAAAAGFFAAYAAIPGGFAIAAANIAAMQGVLAASLAASTARNTASKIPAMAQGGIIDRPTLALMGEVPGSRELVVPETTFRDYFGQLVSRIISTERQVAGYQAMGAGFAMAGSMAGGPTVDLRGASIFTSSSSEMQDFLARAARGYDRRIG